MTTTAHTDRPTPTPVPATELTRSGAAVGLSLASPVFAGWAETDPAGGGGDAAVERAIAACYALVRAGRRVVIAAETGTGTGAESGAGAGGAAGLDTVAAADRLERLTGQRPGPADLAALAAMGEQGLGQAELVRRLLDRSGLSAALAGTAAEVPMAFGPAGPFGGAAVVVTPRAFELGSAAAVPIDNPAAEATRSPAAGSGAGALAPLGPTPARPMRIALLGLGTVGLGVHRVLAMDPERFELAGIAVRDPAKHAAAMGEAAGLLTTDLDGLLALGTDRQPDLVIELIGGRTAALGAMCSALEAGVPIVTANKAVIAEDWERLTEAARAGGRPLDQVRFSAAVGGVMPAVETVRLGRERTAAGGERLSAIRGVVNGTCNFMLDQIAQGQTYPEALAEAQRLGFAEADPTLDVDGTDTAQKLAILVREALGGALTLAEIVETQVGIDGIDVGEVQRAASQGRPMRLVAEARFAADGSLAGATVRPTELDPDDPLAPVGREWNRVVVTLAGGGSGSGEGDEADETPATLVATGKGAGRYPTAQAVLADVFDQAAVFAAGTAAAGG